MNNTLLIVEDNEADVEAYRRMLSAEHKLFDSIDLCRTLGEAEAYFKTKTPICCLIDYSLPDGLSSQFLPKLTLESGLLACPVVAVTGHGNEQVVVELMKCGIQSYLIKAKFSAAELHYTLESAIKSFTLQSKVYFLARHDALTGLLNRPLFMERLDHEMKRIDRYSTRPLQLAYLDLDYFKAINDCYGYDVGDVVLKTVATRLKLTIRETDCAARLGGDEFVFMLPMTRCKDGHRVVQKVLNAFVEPIRFQDQSVQVSVSIGVAQYPSQDEKVNAQQLMKQADTALYRAKTKGRNQYVTFEYSENQDWHHHSDLMKSLPAAIREDALDIAYQPIVRTDNAICERVEALLRYTHRGMCIAPGDLLKSIQSLGLQEVFHRWLFSKTIRQLKRWNECRPNLKMSINVPANICHNSSIFEGLIAEVESAKVRPENVIIEITETYFMGQEEQALASLQRLADYGIQVAIDDFGTGYSSMEYLAVMPCQSIKIDQKFLHESNNPRYRDVIESTIQLGHRLGFSVTAEGVETQEQISYMQSVRCDYLQGFALGNPVVCDADWDGFMSQSRLSRLSA